MRNRFLSSGKIKHQLQNFPGLLHRLFHDHSAFQVTNEVFLLLSGKTDGAVCSVTRKLNIERQRPGHVTQAPVKIPYFTDEFMEIKT